MTVLALVYLYGYYYKEIYNIQNFIPNMLPVMNKK